MTKIGIIGVGHLADYTVRGVRRGGWSGPIFLSPRGEAVGAALARDCGCTVLEGNQAVVDAADIVMLATRPASALEVLGGLTLRSDQVLLSVVAGVPVGEIAAVGGEVGAVVRALPVTSAEVGASPTLIFPPNDVIEGFFSHCGTAIPVGEESAFDAAAVMTCFYGMYIALFDRLTQATTAAGVPEEAARNIVTGMARGAAKVAAAQTEKSLGGIVGEIATEGTFTRLGLDHLEANDAFQPWDEAFDMILKRFRKV